MTSPNERPSKKPERLEEKFRGLFESMTQGVVYHDQSGAVVDANPAAARLLGLSKDQLMGRTSLDLRWRAIREDGTTLAGDDHPDKVAMRTGKPVENFIMGVNVPEEDRYRWISVSAVPQFREGENRPYRVFVTFTDITEIRTTQEALRDNQRLLERALSMAGLGYWELDLTKGTATGSAESRRIYGLGDGALTIADIQKLPRPEYRPLLDRAIEDSSRTTNGTMSPSRYAGRRMERYSRYILSRSTTAPPTGYSAY